MFNRLMQNRTSFLLKPEEPVHLVSDLADRSEGIQDPLVQFSQHHGHLPPFSNILALLHEEC